MSTAHRILYPLVVVALGLASLGSHAAEALASDETGMPDSLFELELEVGGGTHWIFGGDIEGPTGEVDVLVSEVGLDLKIPVGRFTQVGVQLGYEHRHHDWHDGAGIFAGTSQPWEDVHTLSLGGSLLQPISRTWAIFARGGVRMSAADGADLDDGASMNLIAGIGKRFDENLTLGLGVMIATRIEDDPLIVPAPQIDWRIDEHWRVRSQGPGAELILTLDDSWQITGSARWQSRRFRLPNDRIRAGGVAQDARVPLSLETTYTTPDSGVAASLLIGFDVFRDLEISNSQGRNERELGVDPGIFLGGSLELRW